MKDELRGVRKEKIVSHFKTEGTDSETPQSVQAVSLSRFEPRGFKILSEVPTSELRHSMIIKQGNHVPHNDVAH